MKKLSCGCLVNGKGYKLKCELHDYIEKALALKKSKPINVKPPGKKQMFRLRRTDSACGRFPM